MSELAPLEGTRELSFREMDGMAVQLLYKKVGNTVLIHMVDDKEGRDLVFDVPRENANDAFYHPYVYVEPEDVPDYQAA
jgi:hypothetical protein